MQSILKQFGSLVLGGVIVAALLLTNSTSPNSPIRVALAQEPQVALKGTATNPQLLFQGQLLNPTTGQPVADGPYNMTFNLYNVAGGGAPLWSENKTIGASAGLFATMLGSAVPINPDIFNGQQLYLGIAVAGDPEAAPRQPLGYSAYAVFANKADTLDGLHSTDFVRQGNGGLVAYGVVDSSGSGISGQRFSSRRASDGVYEISIDGESYDLNKFVTTVTVVDNSTCSNAVIAKTGSKNGKLNVYLYTLNNNPTACKFHFMTLEP